MDEIPDPVTLALQLITLANGLVALAHASQPTPEQASSGLPRLLFSNPPASSSAPPPSQTPRGRTADGGASHQENCRPPTICERRVIFE